MLNVSIPRIVVSGLKGGSGKTLLTLALITSLHKKGLRITPFKKGPDYIDAGWLAKAAGASCYNLDLFMMSAQQALHSFLSHSMDTDLAIIEGNRGLYDGMDHRGTYSTAELAKLLKSRVVIIVDCTKTSNTIAAMVLGCQKMDPHVSIGGVVLNRVATSRQESVIRKAVNERCSVPVLGAIPRLKKDPFPERHMGLTPFQEHAGIEESIATVADIGSHYLDLDGVVDVAENAGKIDTSDIEQPTPPGALRPANKGPRIGVIRDSAFQFYYEENFEELKKRGAELVEVSPLREDTLPEIDALYIGGGFPETHAIALADNVRFRKALCHSIEEGLPVYAECGGLMYLGKNLILNDKTYPMAGVLQIVFGMQKKPLAHGYTIIEVARENPFFYKGDTYNGHEFHYSKVLEINTNECSFAFHVKRGRGIVDNKDGICYKNVLASYTHLHAIGSPGWADGMVRCAEEFKKIGIRGPGQYGEHDKRRHGMQPPGT